MRDHDWLQNKLQELLSKYFPNVIISNPIEIRFGSEAKFRFGSIKLIGDNSVKGLKGLIGSTPKKSVITITSMFADEKIPAEVVEYTIAHELCHYTHGFSSSNKRMFRHPHHGGIINKELRSRGASHLIVEFKLWLKAYRRQILANRSG